MSKVEEIVIKKYIAGKSLSDIKDYLKTTDLTSEEQENLIIDINQQYYQKRKNVAKRDISIALASILYALGTITFMLITETVHFRVLFFVSLVLWIPFLRSGYNVLFGKDEFPNAF